MRDYVTHWIIGLTALIAWFFGDKLGIPPDAVSYAKEVLGVVIGHAIAYAPADTDPKPSGAPSQPSQPI